MDGKSIKVPRCSFCGETASEDNEMIRGAGGRVFVCRECSERLYAIFHRAEPDDCDEDAEEADGGEWQSTAANRQKEAAEKETKPYNADDYVSEIRKKLLMVNPKLLKESLDYYVVGQERAKKVLSLAVYNHYKRMTEGVRLSGIDVGKNNILLMGPTGVGKTYIIQRLAKEMDVPLAIADANSLTQAGYVGDDVESILTRLLEAAGGNVAKAERGIVYIDEIDKIACRNTDGLRFTRDVSGEGVQQALLKMLEGFEAHVMAKPGPRSPVASKEVINTKNILFICGGAFCGIEDTIRRRIGIGNEKKIGFGAENAAEKMERNDILRQACQDDFIKFGMIPEFMGRLPVICTLDELSVDDLIKIMTEPGDSIMSQYELMFRLEGCHLTVRYGVLRKAAEIALERGIGARGLRSVMEGIMQDAMYECAGERFDECLIEEDIFDGGKPKFFVGGELYTGEDKMCPADRLSEDMDDWTPEEIERVEAIISAS